VKGSDTWDLSSLYGGDDAWRRDLAKWERQIARYEKFRGTLGKSAADLMNCLRFDRDFDRRGERLGYYAFLKSAQDKANSDYQAMQARYMNVATRAEQAASFIRPEIMAIPAAKAKRFLAAAKLKPFRLQLERILRFKQHTLSDKEENLLAMQGEMADVAHRAFDQLLNCDLKFGTVRNEKGEEIELSNATFSTLLNSPKRGVRKNAFDRYYAQFASHENTLAAMLTGSIQKDIYYAKAKGYPSALEASLFADNMPTTVYDNLIASVRRRLPAIHRYYDVRRRKMRLREIHQYDTYVPILTDLETRRNWNQAVKLILAALEPLGDDYLAVLENGLLGGRWCDRYPNQGKSSGAFSAGSFDGKPYILMNYQPTVLNHVFTLAHEAGHSMHSYYSSKSQPYQYYNYTIFVAEVASTFNESLLGRHLMDRARSDRERAYLVNKEIDDIRGTIIRQTMFAEFEKITHAMAEAGEPLTVKILKETYRRLIVDYFGPDFTVDEQLDLECFRIPHFYRAFYVYKYATGLSAAIALSRRVLDGGPRELANYLRFLKGGCSKFPLDLLRDAGVDMESPEPVDTALSHFEALVEELDELL